MGHISIAWVSCALLNYEPAILLSATQSVVCDDLNMRCISRQNFGAILRESKQIKVQVFYFRPSNIISKNVE